jgi:ABC-type branched-subunit amino acid transport system permease subunit
MVGAVPLPTFMTTVGAAFVGGVFGVVSSAATGRIREDAFMVFSPFRDSP